MWQWRAEADNMGSPTSQLCALEPGASLLCAWAASFMEGNEEWLLQSGGVWGKLIMPGTRQRIVRAAIITLCT